MTTLQLMRHLNDNSYAEICSQIGLLKANICSQLQWEQRIPVLDTSSL